MKRKKRPDTRFRILRKTLFGSNAAFPIEEEAVQSPLRTILRNFRENGVAMTGLITFLLIFLACFLLPLFFPLDKTYQDVTQQNVAPGFGLMTLPSGMKSGVRQISVGSTFSVGINEKGEVLVWGKASDRLKDIPENMGNVVQVSAGLDHILALNDQGQLFTWGNNRFSLGSIPPELTGRMDIRQILAGHQISMVLTGDGRLTYWGNENLISLRVQEVQGQVEKVILNTTTGLVLLRNGRIAALTTKSTPFSAIPEELQGRAVDLAATDKAAAAVTSSGQVFVWGSGDYGILEVPAGLQGNAASIEAGRAHFSALTSDGSAISWGSGNFHQTDVPSSLGRTSVTALYAGSYQNYAVESSGKVTSWGLRGYLMGTDGYGRDVFVRLISGGRLTMTIGAIAVILSTLIGITVGGFSGYYGGKVDMILMRFAEIVGSIPFLPLAIILSAIVGNRVSEIGRISMIMVILGVLSWPGLSRLVRAQILSEREKEFVTAAKAIGVREMAIIFKHILPNVITVIIVNATLDFATCLLTESSLSFLGFGVIEPSPTWGNMLTGSQSSTVIGTYWWRWVFPALALSLATISINLIGDGLRDAIDPKSNER